MDLFNSPEFSSHVESLLEEHHVPGIAIALVQDEHVASKGYGYALLEPRKPCTADTLFDIASCSKSLTAASVALLVESDEYPDVKWDAKMSDLLPDDFVLSEESYTKDVTVEDVLSHRTGVPRHDWSYFGIRAAQPPNTRSIVRSLRHLPVAVPIRSKQIYNNMMYTAAVHLVEQKSGLSFSDYLHKHFFEPLGMGSTSLQPSRARDRGFGDRITAGHAWKKDEETYQSFQTPECPEAEGAGSIITSANDYIKWVKAMINHEGPITEDVINGIIKPRIINDMDDDDLDPFTDPGSYAVGWDIFYYRGHKVVTHNGGVPGFGTRHTFLPDHKFGCAVFGNSGSGGTIADIVVKELIDEILKVPKGDRVDWNKREHDNEKKWQSGEQERLEKLRRELCPGIKESQPQTQPLGAYTGDYHNAGYHGMTVEVKDGKLFIDASDRSMGFFVTFEHVCDQTKYLMHMKDYLDGEVFSKKAEFVLENGKATRMGLLLEDSLDDYIWFERP
ncbi:hypothetical protein PFICI_11470 [Pestalotiopsis fici W106-1]|uniref:Beta-lactamase-related domain-containing protein n=1 Tax=Pestalotiopsis fici (strain W106-1 / CGMCC3.15140) TaxID=1229662 RepID=W3WQF4_PESFW|nr:uncharacterized protein PFICI_11470 [Pestalotiopsis fici W106-1]ETS76083.1 hypothetical protein PFICI_11470 [Pestalotiopsis fici W106-1]